jgi:enoyl-CoA hydratase/carnithine racemase
MSNDAVLYEKTENIVVLTMNRPENRNANSTPEMIDSFCDAINRINLDYEIGAVIITGKGSTYSSGGETTLMQQFATMNPLDVRNYYIHYGIQKLTRAMYSLEVPAIAAVNGPAYGSGCGSAAMCDIRFASETAVFAVNFSHLGMLAGDGGSYFLNQIVGPEKAAEMIYTGDPIDAQEALRCGLVSRVFPQDQLMDEAMKMARRIASNPPKGLRMAKRLLREARQAARFDAFLDLTAALQGLGHGTPEYRERLDVFLAKLHKKGSKAKNA